MLSGVETKEEDCVEDEDENLDVNIEYAVDLASVDDVGTDIVPILLVDIRQSPN